MKAKHKVIQLIGRRWFQSTYGNTYHSITIIIDGVQVHYESMLYGYDSMWEQNIRTWLEKNNIIPYMENYPFWQVKEILKDSITFISSVSDVSRKKDL